MKVKHKPDREGFKENDAEDGMQGSFPRFLTVKNFNLTERESNITAVTCVILNKKGNPITS